MSEGTFGLVHRHPVASYFALTFALSWGGLLWASGGPGGIPVDPEEVDALLPLFILSVLIGPSVSGLLLTAVVDGRAGLRALGRRVLRWRSSPGWYLVALLTAPLIMTALLLVLSLMSPQFVPAIFAADDRTALVVAGVLTALGAGVFEELGWTGFATPKLRTRWSVVQTGLIVGFFWAAWHLLPAYWLSSTVSGRLALLSYMLDPFLFLVVFRVLIVWAYDGTGSILLAMLMHLSLTFGARVLTPQGISGVPLLMFDVLWAAVMTVVVVGVVVSRRTPRALPASGPHGPDGPP